LCIQRKSWQCKVPHVADLLVAAFTQSYDGLHTAACRILYCTAASIVGLNRIYVETIVSRLYALISQQCVKAGSPNDQPKATVLASQYLATGYNCTFTTSSRHKRCSVATSGFQSKNSLCEECSLTLSLLQHGSKHMQ
jgi:hypothetical protein